MKRMILIFVILLSVTLSACASRRNYSRQGGPEISTTLPDNAFPPSAGVTSLPPAVQSPATIVLDDNGKTFNFQVGDTFLLDLGTDVYDWTVTVDNQDVIALKMGLMAIKGAQGTFDALSPGTATLTAVGDPLCRKSSPPCGMPTILFKVILIVQ
jgi:hypothetical protein